MYPIILVGQVCGLTAATVIMSMDIRWHHVGVGYNLCMCITNCRIYADQRSLLIDIFSVQRTILFFYLNVSMFDYVHIFQVIL